MQKCCEKSLTDPVNKIDSLFQLINPAGINVRNKGRRVAVICSDGSPSVARASRPDFYTHGVEFKCQHFGNVGKMDKRKGGKKFLYFRENRERRNEKAFIRQSGNENVVGR